MFKPDEQVIIREKYRSCTNILQGQIVSETATSILATVDGEVRSFRPEQVSKADEAFGSHSNSENPFQQTIQKSYTRR